VTRVTIPEGEYELVIASKTEMVKLSRRYGKLLGDKKFALHEVISFPLEEGMKFEHPDGIKRLGSVVVLSGLNVEKTRFLIQHGVEHLLGRHHE